MKSFRVLTPIYTEALEGVWEKIPIKFLSILNISLKGTNVIVTAKQQFEIFYEGRSLIYTDDEKAQNAFLMIFFGNSAQLILKQIELAETQLIDRISDLSIWADVTKSESAGEGDRTNKTITDSKNIVRAANTDSNSLMTQEIVAEHFDVNSTSVIAPNSFNQSLTKDDNSITTTDTNRNTNNVTTSFSNESKDIIEYLRMDLPDLRQKFWSLFHCLFSY